MDDNQSSWADVIAEAILRICPDNTPDDVRALACLHGLDTVGIALAAAHGAFGPRLQGWLDRTQTAGEAPVVGLARPVAPVDAAFANSALAHATDFDDTHSAAFLHPSAVVWGTALAHCREAHVTGRDLLCAVLSGYEAMCRLGRMAVGEFNWRGFHTTSILGALAAAVVSTRLQNGSAATMAAAISTATTLAAGLLEGMRDGSDVKMLQVGWAARAGVGAAGLAQRGFQAPRRGLEGVYGLFNAHLESFAAPVEAFFEDVTARWETRDLVPKFYPVCHHIQGFMDAAHQLRQHPAFNRDGLQRVVCRVALQQVPVVCEPVHERRRPSTPYAARFSMPYCVALVLAGYDGGLDDFEEPRLSDATVLALASKVEYEATPLEAFPRLFPAHLQLYGDGGCSLEARFPSVRGQAGREVTRDDMVGKFRRVTGFLDEARQDALVEAFAALAETENLSPLARLIGQRQER